jgi:hypothetical protein
MECALVSESLAFGCSGIQTAMEGAARLSHVDWFTDDSQPTASQKHLLSSQRQTKRSKSIWDG